MLESIHNQCEMHDLSFLLVICTHDISKSARPFTANFGGDFRENSFLTVLLQDHKAVCIDMENIPRQYK